MTVYPGDLRKLVEDDHASASDIDAALAKHMPGWLAWEVPTVLLELDRGGASVSPANQSRIRGLHAMHVFEECYVSIEQFEALAWLLAGIAAPSLRPTPIVLLRAIDTIRKVAAAHGEHPPELDQSIVNRIAEICRQDGFIALPPGFEAVQAALREGLSEEDAAIEKKAQLIASRARSSGDLEDHVPDDATPEGVAGARCVALELSLRA